MYEDMESNSVTHIRRAETSLKNFATDLFLGAPS